MPTIIRADWIFGSADNDVAHPVAFRIERLFPHLRKPEPEATVRDRKSAGFTHNPEGGR